MHNKCKVLDKHPTYVKLSNAYAELPEFSVDPHNFSDAPSTPRAKLGATTAEPIPSKFKRKA